jgi:hypothetical protein
VAALAGLAAIVAPASLTGSPVVDAIERAVVAAFVTFVGAHGRRWTWLVAGMVVATTARGASLAIVLVALAVLVAATVPKRRPKVVGAVGLGILVNAPLWYPPAAAPEGALAATTAYVVLVAFGLRYVRSPRRQVAQGVLIAILALCALGGLGVAVATLLAQPRVSSGASEAHRALDAARDGDAPTAQQALAEARDDFGDASSWVGGFLTLPARLVPGLAQQAHAVRVTVREGERVSALADDLVATADYDSLKYQGHLDLTQVRGLAGPSARADDALADAGARLDEVRHGVLLPPLRSRIEEFHDQLADAADDAHLAAELLRVTPDLFGASGTRRYLVVFVTPAELRGGGGFIGSYAELTATAGRVRLTRSGRISDLIFAKPLGTRTLSGPPDYLRRYERMKPEDYPQDATASPDFPSDAQVLAELYPQSGGRPVDGVISVDPTGLAALLELSGPVAVPGLPDKLSAANAVEVLTRTQYLQFPDEAQRGEILSQATKATFERLIDAELPAPRRLADVLSPAARSGHLRLWSKRPAEQAVFQLLGADGALRVPAGYDGLMVAQQNAGNNKLDAYLHRTITYDATVDATDGSLEAKLRIVLRNDVPSLDLPDPVVDNARAAPRGTNVTWLTVFTPHQVARATIDGQEVQLGPDREAGLNAFDTPLVEVPPGGQVVIEVDLVGGLDLSRPYRLRLLPQPVANPDRFSASLTIRHGRSASHGAHRVQLIDGAPLTAPTDRRVRVVR